MQILSDSRWRRAIIHYMTDYFLGTYRQVAGERQIREIVRITRDEFDRYRLAAVEFRRLLMRVPIQIVERNYRELCSLTGYYGKLFSLPRGSAAIVTHAAIALSRVVINWLTSFRLFLDQASTDLARRFGSGSDQLLTYQAATHAAYDRSAAYRLIYRFRNYVQHCGMPFSRVRAGIADHETRSTYVEFVVGRDELLEGFDWNRSERADLQALAEDVDVVLLIDEAIRELRSISRTVLEIDIRSAIANAGVLEEAVARIGAAGDEAPMLMNRPGELGETFSISDVTLPFASDLQLLRDAESSEDPVAVMLERDDRLDEVAHSTAQSDHLDRGVAIMATWYEQGGATPAFHRFVSGLIRQDGGIEPVVTELTFTAAVGLGMAGAAAGTGAENVLGGLVAEPPD